MLKTWIGPHQYISSELSPTSLKTISSLGVRKDVFGWHDKPPRRIWHLPTAQAQSSSHELIHATCRENACLRQNVVDLEKAVQFWQQSLSEKALESTQLVSGLRHSQKTAVDLQASANSMHFQLRQQAVMMASVKEKTAKTFRLKEQEIQKRIQVKEELDVERHLEA